MSLSAYLPLDEILTSSPSNSIMAEENKKDKKKAEETQKECALFLS